MGWFFIWQDVLWHYFKGGAALCGNWERIGKANYKKKPGSGNVCEECLKF